MKSSFYRMMFRNICFTFIVISSNTFSANLLDIYRMSLQNSAQWQSFQIRQQQAELIAEIAQAKLKPYIGLTASLERQWLDSNAAQFPQLKNTDIIAFNQCLILNNDYNICLNQTSSLNCDNNLACIIGEDGSNQRVNTAQVGIQIKQPLYNAALWHEVKQAHIQKQQSNIKLKQQQQDFLAQLIEAYLTTLSARESAQANAAELKQRQAQLNHLERQFEQGLLPASDVLYGRAMLALQRSTADQKKRASFDAFRALEALTQQPIVKLSNLQEDIPMPQPNPSNVGQWIAIAQKANPNLLHLKQQVQVSQQEISKRKGLRKPTVQLVAAIGTGSTDKSGSFDQQSQASSAEVKIELSVPLYGGGALTRRVKEANNLHQQATLQLTSAQERLSSEIEIAFNASSSGFHHIQLLQEVIHSLKLRLRNLEKGFENGIVGAQDVLEAREELFKTEKNKQIARFEYIRSSIDLKKLAGILNEHDIHVIASWSAASTTAGAQHTLFDQAKEWLRY